MPNLERGRKQNSLNKTNAHTSEQLSEWITHEMQKAIKLFPVMGAEKVFSELRMFLEILFRKVKPETRAEIAEVLYLLVAKEFLRMDRYFSHVKNEQKFSELRKLLPLLKPEHIKEISEFLAKKIRK
jgi:hypothetical protein